MAHSLHNLVLDVCCNNTSYYATKEEALKVIIQKISGEKDETVDPAGMHF